MLKKIIKTKFVKMQLYLIIKPNFNNSWNIKLIDIISNIVDQESSDAQFKRGTFYIYLQFFYI